MLVTHTLRSALNDINVDLTGVERSIADKVEAMSSKIEALEARLAAYEESLGFQDERSSCKETINGPEATEEVSKPKAKQRASRAKKTG
jgi:hypothetical protein